MLNSMNLTSNGHYPLKIKSMFDLAIASSQRYSISPSQTPLQQHPPHHHQRHNHQINYSGSHLPPQQPHHQYNSLEMTHQHHHILNHPKSNCPIKRQPDFGLVGPKDNNNGGGIVTIEDCSVGNGNGGMYPRSPQSDSSHKSNDSSMSPNAIGEGRAVSPVAFNNNNGPMTPTGSIMAPDCGGKSMGRSKQGQGSASSGGKPSFSIESLLAHSSGWRRQQNQPSETGGSKGVSMKDNRFLPYHIPSPQQQQQQQQQQPAQQLKRSSDNSGVSSKATNPTCQPSDNEKRTDNFGGSSKTGGSTGASGRRATKSKRVRTIFTPEQLERLEAEFERQQYMVGPERLYLASSLYLTEAQVKVWFQNRRIKWRKQHLEMEQQRLAIYRTLAEQDMMASAGDDEDDDEPGEDSPDCDYDMDETDSIAGGGGGEGDHFPTLHNSQQLRAKVNHSYPLNCSPSAPQSLHHIGIPTASSTKPPKSISVTVSNQNTKSERTRLPLQQTSSNEDYDASSSTTHSSGSPSSFGGITSAAKGDDYSNNNGSNLQGVKN